MIKLLILDVDGVLTDGKKYYDSNGKVVMKTFCDKDWTAIKRFKALGIKVIFLTGDHFNTKIATNRNIEVIINRAKGKHTDKVDYLDKISKKYNASYNEIIFVGDDIFDFKIMKMLKYKYCPSDATDEIKKISTCILDAKGGQNCIMVLFDTLKKAKIISKYNIEKHLTDIYKLDLKEKF